MSETLIFALLLAFYFIRTEIIFVINRKEKDDLEGRIKQLEDLEELEALNQKENKHNNKHVLRNDSTPLRKKYH